LVFFKAINRISYFFTKTRQRQKRRDITRKTGFPQPPPKVEVVKRFFNHLMSPIPPKNTTTDLS